MSRDQDLRVGQVESESVTPDSAGGSRLTGDTLPRAAVEVGGGITLAAVTLPVSAGNDGAGARAVISEREPSIAKLPLGHTDTVVSVFRAEDMVALTFAFHHFVLDKTGANLVCQRTPSADGKRVVPLILVSHGPQHLLERSFAEDDTTTPAGTATPASGPISTRLSARSRVAYLVPDTVTSIPFTVEDLLAVARDYELAVGFNATPPDPPAHRYTLHPGGLALTPLLSSGFLVAQTDPTPLASKGTTVAATPTLTQLVRATRGLRAAAVATGQDLGFSPGALSPHLPPLEILPTEPLRAKSSETSLEIPFRVEMSPNRNAQWAHTLSPVKGNDQRYELWHSRLATRGVDGKPYEGASYLNTIRALWTRDEQMHHKHGEYYENDPKTDPIEASLVPRDRVRIVHQSSNFTLRDTNDKLIRPKPITVNRLMLTALGGWMDVRGDWGDDPRFGLSVWEHRAAMGRDNFVKVVETGYLYPFGHRAVRITISERKLRPEHPHVAYVRKRTFLAVKQPSLDYTAGRDLPELQPILRKLPFTRIHIKTLTTPNLTIPANRSTTMPVCVGDVPFCFACEALDPEGRLVQFSAPVVWVQGNQTGDPVTPARFANAQDAFDAYGEARACDCLGQRVAYAESNRPDDTTYETHNIQFAGVQPNPSATVKAAYQSTFVPVIASTELAIEAARQLAGAGATTTFAYHTSFTNNGFGAGNSGEVLFGLAESAAPIDVSFSKASDKTGGFLTPNFKLSGLSRKIGPAAGSDLSSLAGGSFNPDEFFGGLEAKIFGVIDLFSIIDTGAIDSIAPKFITQALDVVEGFIDDAKALLSDAATYLDAASGVVTALQTVLDDFAFDPSTGLPDLAKLEALRGHLTSLGTALGSIAGAPFPGGMNQGLKQNIIHRAQQLQGLIATINLPTGPLDLFFRAAEMAKDLRVHLEWRPPLKSFSISSDLGPLFEPKDPANTLILSADIRAKDLPGKPAGVDLVASLENFKINLMGAKEPFLVIPFKHIRFSVLAGKKPDVDVVFEDMVWGGVLAFVKTLMEIIPSTGFSDPPALTVDESGISASFSVALPSLAIGMFSLQNISLGAGFKVPFIGDPLSISFNFCTRENPFILTVMMIGGGGFFGITLDPKGVKMLEAQFDAGASLALDFGVASGSVSVMVGVYFKMEYENVTLTAFLKIHGEVEVLGGIISASLTLELDLTYESANGGKLVGTASMEIEVHVLFFSVTVTASYSKKLAGSNGDPSFADAMRPSLPSEDAYDPWAEYVNAFAA